MQVIQTRIFGEVGVEEDKVLTFEQGIIGYPELQKFILLYDLEKPDAGGIKWLQSVEESQFALPVIDPLLVKADYDPQVEDELLKPLGELTQDNIFILTTITVPNELSKMSVNLMAPIIINVDSKKASQLIVDGDYPIKFPVYEILQARKQEAMTGKAGE